MIHCACQPHSKHRLYRASLFCSCCYFHFFLFFLNCASLVGSRTLELNGMSSHQLLLIRNMHIQPIKSPCAHKYYTLALDYRKIFTLPHPHTHIHLNRLFIICLLFGLRLLLEFGKHTQHHRHPCYIVFFFHYCVVTIFIFQLLVMHQNKSCTISLNQPNR